ncbi:MAG: ABC transporter substrate-binding protein [Thermodesulfobacteriota bacterium]|jgi:multiple sugar transport system substrate-binding protein
MVKKLVVKLMVLAVVIFVATAPGIAQEKLVIWWNKSFIPQQDEAFKEIVQKWEKKTGKQADLSFFALPDHPAKMLAAFDSKIVPDVDFGQIVNTQTALFAYDDRLLEISDVLNPIRSRFVDVALRGTEFLDAKTGKRGTYAFPLMQHGVNIHYWLDMVQTAGFRESDIPKQWKPFWDFWGEVQKRLRAKGERIYGIGITYSVESTDNWQEFYHFMEAYRGRILDDNGKLIANDPKMRQNIIAAMDDFTRHYKAKNVPPGAISWKDIDNNLNFNNRQIVMTMNPTLSIPGSFLGKNDDYYYNKIKTLRWPTAPDGKLFPLRSSVHSGFIPKDAKNKDLAKDFVRFLLEPENLDLFVKASNGAFFPSLKESYKDPFFVSADPHRAAVYKNFTDQPNRNYEIVLNHKYPQVDNENVVGRACGRILSENWTTAKAVDEMIARMKQILED